MRLLRFIVFGLVFLLLVGLSFGECPPCDYYAQPMEGAGAGPAGLTLANIYIDSSWNVDQNGNSISGTNSNLWNAVCAGTSGSGCENAQGPSAIAMWNYRLGTTGQSAPYYFQVNQSFSSHTDVYIQRGSPQGGCGDIVWDNGHYVMTLADSVKNLPQQWLAALVAHELGHALGLLNSADSGDPNCSTTIMNGHLENCEQLIKDVQTADVDAAYKFQSDRGHCSNAPAGGGGGGGDGGEGGTGTCVDGEETYPTFGGDRNCYDIWKVPYRDCGHGRDYGSAYFWGTTCNDYE